MNCPGGDASSRFRLESLKNHVVYLRDGQPDAINVMACR